MPIQLPLVSWATALACLSLLITPTTRAAVGDRWTAITPSFPHSVLVDVEHDGSRFLALNFNGRISTSQDGHTWQPLAELQQPFSFDMAVDNGRYAVLSAGGTIHTSRDGVNWARRFSPGTLGSGGITAGNGRFLAAFGDTLVSSTDLDTWTPVNIGTISGGATSFKKIVWTGQRFILVGTNGFIASSPTGASGTWQQPARCGTTYLKQIAHDDTGTRVVVFGTDGMCLSQDGGINWRILLSPPRLSTAIWHAGRFIGLNDEGKPYYSADGNTWNSGTTPPPRAPAPFIALAASGNTLVAAGTPGIMLSENNGDTWRLPGHTLTLAALTSIAWSGDRFVAVGTSATTLMSRDGRNWQLTQLPYPDTLRNLVWTGNQFLASGTNGNLFSSADGITWTRSTTGFDNITHLASNGSVILLANKPSLSPATLHYSTDNGSTWQSASLNFTPDSRDNLRALTWTGSRFLALFERAGLAQSMNGATWQKVATGALLPATPYFTGLADNGRRLLVTASDFILYSDDGGDTWQKETPNPTGLTVTAAVAGRFLASTELLADTWASTDGIQWQPFSDYKLLAAQTTTDRAVAVGYSGSILLSTDEAASSSGGGGGGGGGLTHYLVMLLFTLLIFQRTGLTSPRHMRHALPRTHCPPGSFSQPPTRTI